MKNNIKKKELKKFSILGKKDANEKQIVDPKHPYWNAVYARLVPTYNEKECNHNHELVEKMLVSLPNVDVEDTIKFYRENGGHCDCEVINNVYMEGDELRLSGYQM